MEGHISRVAIITLDYFSFSSFSLRDRQYLLWRAYFLIGLSWNGVFCNVVFWSGVFRNGLFWKWCICWMFRKVKQDCNHPGCLNVEIDDPRHNQLFPCGAESVFYFVWFPLSECKVLSASRRLFSLLWVLVAALQPAAKRLVLDNIILN